MKKTILVLLTLFFVSCIFGQKIGSGKHQSLHLHDTMANIVTDGFVHDLGTIPIKDTILTKYFKYIGGDKTPVSIVNTWTGDPYWISEYPKGVLTKGNIYSFKVTFIFSNKPIKFEKIMGFHLSNGYNIKFTFKGNVKNQT